MFGGCFVYLSLYAVNQAQVAEIHCIDFEENLWEDLWTFENIMDHICWFIQVQRLLTLPTLKRAQAALWLQVFSLTIQIESFGFAISN